jgi:hypothetical protein
MFTRILYTHNDMLICGQLALLVMLYCEQSRSNFRHLNFIDSSCALDFSFKHAFSLTEQLSLCVCLLAVQFENPYEICFGL